MLHDGQAGGQTRQDVINFVMELKPEQAVVAQESYTHQEGWHVHVFYRLANQTRFQTTLQRWCTFWRSGRVQVDAMRGTMAQACRYLHQEETAKDKHCDVSPWCYPSQMIRQDPKVYAGRWILDWLPSTFVTSDYENYENFKNIWKASMWQRSMTCTAM